MAEIRRRTLVYVLAAILGPLLIWILLDALIVTDSKRISAMCEQMACATGAKDTAGMVQFIAENYNYEGLTRDDLRSMAESYFEEYGDTTATITTSTVHVQGALATADVVVAVHAARGELADVRVATRWRLTFARMNETASAPGAPKIAKVWRIIQIQPVAVGRMNVDNWKAITEHLRWSPRKSGESGRLREGR